MREIAEKEQCSVVSVKYSIDRAIQKLKENMK